MALSVRAMTCREEREGQIVADGELFEGKNRVAAHAAAPRSSHVACHRARPPPPPPRACLLNRRKGGLGPAGVPGTSRLAGTPRSDSPELHAWDSLIHFAGGEARRRGQPEPPLPPYPPPCPALTSEADSRLICVGRKKELFPFYFIFITNCVPQT